jgi:hypothetical protein
MLLWAFVPVKSLRSRRWGSCPFQASDRNRSRSSAFRRFDVLRRCAIS